MGGVNLAAVFACAYAAVLVLRAVCAWREIHRQAALPAADAAWAMSGVAVLQPILGGDPRLAEVLDETLDALPGARFHWLVDDGDTQARVVIASLRAAHPRARVAVEVNPPAPDGVNPKSFKLDRALAAVEAPVCLVLDDDATLTAGALARLVAALDTAEIATALPAYVDDGEPMAGRLLARFVNDNAALTYLAPLAWAPPVSINGMCYAMRTAHLRALGGFAPLLHALADDLAMADHVRAHGGRIAQAIAPVRVRTSIEGPAHYIRQMHRWMLFATLLLRRQPLRLQLGIIVLHGVPPLLLWATGIALLARPSVVGVLGAGGVLVLRAAVTALLQRRPGGAAPPAPLLSLLSELLQPLHLMHAVCVRTVRWRRRRYRVHADGGFHVA